MDIQKHLFETGAHLKGHFLLSSGLHSDQYFQCAELLQYPALARQAGESLAALFEGQKIDPVIRSLDRFELINGVLFRKLYNPVSNETELQCAVPSGAAQKVDFLGRGPPPWDFGNGS